MKRLVFATCLAALLVSLVTKGFPSIEVKAEKRRVNSIEPIDQFVRGRVLVRFHDDILPDHARNIIAALGARDADEISGIGVHILDLPYQANEMAFAQAFEARPEVEFAELDRLLPAQQMVPDDPLYDNPNSWSLPRINAPDAWSISTGSSNVIIAILDTGVDATHPDLASQIVPGWNIYNNNADTSDVYGHGTAVAGTAAAASNNAIGVASVAWGCRLMPVRISDSTGMATDSAIASGLSWAASHGARVANISYYITGSRTISSAAKSFQSKGGVVIAAAGNYGVSETIGDDPYIVTVGATDSSDNLYSWSNRGNNLDVVAPGNVYTTMNGGGYGCGGGTSFASPIVAGVAALILSTNPSLTAQQVQGILTQNADDLGAPGWDSTYGYGRINAARAVTAAQAGGVTSDTSAPSVSITSPTAGGVVSGAFSVQVSVNDNVGVVKNELYVDGVLISTSTTAPFTVKWNTRKAAAGAHELLCRAYDAAGNVGVSPAVIVYK
jgi:subtilisin family serine protease